MSDPLTVHGGRRRAAQARFPDAPRPWLDLSTGINPVPYPLPTLDPAVFTDLPEPEDLARLESIAAAAYGVPDPALVVAAPGTQILIELLPLLAAPGAAAVLGPTYGEHGPGWARAGHRVREARSLAELDGASHAVVVNPNNPDGRVLKAADLIPLAARLDRAGGFLVVDEAFADLEPGVSLAPYLPRPGLVILRSFGKTYGLAGVRLGFLLAAPEIAAAMREALGAWAVSGPAMAIGTGALGDERWRMAAAAATAEKAARLDALMAGAGFRLEGGCRLFRLYGHAAAGAWFERLGRAGILARPFAYRPDWLRLGLPADEAAFARLAAALA
ncbi:threonine-phosphate decarboxylase CobD [Zavarzinia compransoris]|nr:threonine-phosphate decarboxylase CobD [Zavarzinia compransoris]TDP40391.1 L-threonine O-3-phosphate decarboxylase [Zavarzinia compransoris]